MLDNRSVVADSRVLLIVGWWLITGCLLTIRCELTAR